MDVDRFAEESRVSRYPDDRDALLGSTLRRLRKERKLEPADVAARAGLSVVDLTRVERGSHRVGLDTLVRILSALGAGRELAESLRPEGPGRAQGQGSGTGADPDGEDTPPSPRRARSAGLGEPLTLL